MTAKRVLFGMGLLVGLVLQAACEKAGEPPPRFNERLGGSAAGAPLRAASVDTGILSDQKQYQPAAAVGGTGSAGGTSTGDVATDVRAAIVGAGRDLIAGNMDEFLELFDREQLGGPLADDISSSLYEVHEKVVALCNVLTAKTGEDPLAKAGEQVAQLGDMLKVDALDPDNASVGISPQALAMAQAAAIGASPGMQPPALPADAELPTMMMKRQDGKWRIQLPQALSEEEVSRLKTGLKVAKDFLDKLTEKIQPDNVNPKDPAQMQGIVMQVFMELMGESPELQELMSGGGPGLGGLFGGAATTQPEANQDGTVEEGAAAPGPRRGPQRGLTP